MLTTEELRIAALEASSKRGKTVAQRRIARRWLQWFSWSVLFPLIGLVTLLCALIAFVAYEYLGHDVAYKTTMTWIQTQFNKNEITDNSAPAIKAPSVSLVPTPSSSVPASNIPTLKIDPTLSLQNLKPERLQP